MSQLSDGGEADPFLAAALAAYSPEGSPAATYAALLDARVLVPVIAELLERDDVTGGDKRSEMQLLTLVAGEGEHRQEALLVFTSWQSMQRWRADVRPVPLSAVDACGIAVERDYDAIVLDVAGPVRLVIDGEDLESLSRGYQPIDADERLSAKTATNVEIRHVEVLPPWAEDAVELVGIDYLALEITEGDGVWRPAIGVMVDESTRLADVVRELADHLAHPIDIVPMARQL